MVNVKQKKNQKFYIIIFLKLIQTILLEIILALKYSKMSSLDMICLKDLTVQAIIGVNKGERKKKQNIIVNVIAFFDVSKCGRTDNVEDTIDYSEMCKRIVQYIETSQHYTLEVKII